MKRPLAILALSSALAVPAVAQEPMRLFAAGSLRAAMTDVAAAFEAADGGKVMARFGPSGMLRDAIVKGEAVDVFASANMEHPQALVASGAAGPVVLFARNEACAFARPGFPAPTSATLLDALLDPATKLGTSTPKADPGGDYAFAMFARADAVKPGAHAILAAKALQLVGGPNSPATPPERNAVGYHLTSGQADLFIAYCSGRTGLEKDAPGVTTTRLPETLATRADYGMTAMKAASPQALRFALFVMSADGQAILARHGFAAPALPAP
jgi:molybdate transport system substrate-binding protein